MIQGNMIVTTICEVVVFFMAIRLKGKFDMKNFWTVTQMDTSGIGVGIGWFFGGLDGFFYALIAFVVIDYFIGVMCAVVDKTRSSSVRFKGIFRKILIFVMVGIGHIIDSSILKNGNAFRTAVIFFYISNEGICLLENASHIRLPIPQKLKDIWAQLHNRDESD